MTLVLKKNEALLQTLINKTEFSIEDIHILLNFIKQNNIQQFNNQIKCIDVNLIFTRYLLICLIFEISYSDLELIFSLFPIYNVNGFHMIFNSLYSCHSTICDNGVLFYIYQYYIKNNISPWLILQNNKVCNLDLNKYKYVKICYYDL